ncbi:MAG: secretin [Firmicutes bacterium]|nr:secretin [Bacillota bacterium]
MGKHSRYLALCVGLVLVMLAGTAFAGAVSDEPLVTIMLFDTDLKEALSEISLQTGVSIIADQTVSGQVTVDLMDVPLEKALRMILFTGGFSFRKVDDFYFVGLPDPRNSTFGALVETEVVELRHVQAQEILDQMPAFLATYVKGLAAGNLLTVSAPPLELQRVLKLIEQLDTPRKTVEIKVLVTEVSNKAIQELGNDSLEFTAAYGESFNKNWTTTLGFAGNLLSLDTTMWGHLVTKLKLLEGEQEAKIHADPRIIVADGKTAELFIGDRQILWLKSDSDETTSRTERIDVGVALKVTPTVVAGNEVILNIAPEVSHFVDDARPDIVVKRNAVTSTIRLASGQTAVLAGMTMDDYANLSKKVPILGDIPLLRWLFRSDVKRQSDREVLVFVTPVIQ